MIEQCDKSIGVFDSGLGGLTVLRELKQALPLEKFIYFGDTARTPYGTKSPETIKRYALEAARFLLARDVKLVVVACNTVSSVCMSEVESACAQGLRQVPVVGTISPAIEVLRASAHKRVGVLGTQATVQSEAYQSAIRRELPAVEVSAQACPLFVPLVEQGMFEGDIVDKVIDLYLGDLRREHIDALILGCTHYPMLAPSISKYLGDGVEVVHCSRAIAGAVSGLLERQDLLRPKQSAATLADSFYVTDEVSRFNALAKLCLGGVEVCAVKVEDL